MPESSNLLKIALAVGNDNQFRARVEAATWVASPPVDFTDAVLRKVAAEVADSITLGGDDGRTVDTTGVTDDQITAAVTA